MAARFCCPGRQHRILPLEGHPFVKGWLMLKELRIQNFAIIQDLELHFSSGLVIFTGETGAGKSIILDAIMALVGGKVDGSMVRKGAERAVLEALFPIPETYINEITGILKREDLFDNEPHLTLAREIRAEGRNIARVNGRSVNVGLLRELGNFLVDIHGQSEHLSLLNVHSHLGLLDRYASSETELADYKAAYHRLQELRKELKSLRELEQEAARRSELLTFQLQEIEAAHLQPGEEEYLDQERARLANAETLSTSAQQALELLDEGTPEASSASDLLGQASRLVSALARIDPGQESLQNTVDELENSLAEVNRELRSYLDNIEFNPKRLEQVETRLELIHQLKRKYGGTIDAVREYAQNSRLQLEKVQSAGERIRELVEKEKAVIADVITSGKILSATRRKAADHLSKAMETELNDLSLAGAQFAVKIEQPPSPHGLEIEAGSRIAFFDTGLDQVEFLIAPNPGEGLKPLVKIASGGETSRLMLALKNVLAQVDFIPTLIFDEIDQGIGGRVGFVVGEKLWSLGRNHQVLCVTHLPQLAAFGDEHFKVSKQVVGERTLTGVDTLAGSDRVLELAQMTGSETESNLKAAREMLLKANERQIRLM
jgi:DNA repair protein RecN (Recombination protein N)